MLLLLLLLLCIAAWRRRCYSIQSNTAYGKAGPLYEEVLATSGSGPVILPFGEVSTPETPPAHQTDHGVSFNSEVELSGEDEASDDEHSCSQTDGSYVIDSIESIGDNEPKLAKIFELTRGLGTVPEEQKKACQGLKTIGCHHSMTVAPNSFTNATVAINCPDPEMGIVVVVSEDPELKADYEQVQHDEKTIQLIKGMMQPYERVSYGQVTEEMWKRMSSVASNEHCEHNSQFNELLDSEAVDA